MAQQATVRAVGGPRDIVVLVVIRQNAVFLAGEDLRPESDRAAPRPGNQQVAHFWLDLQDAQAHLARVGGNEPGQDGARWQWPRSGVAEVHLDRRAREAGAPRADVAANRPLPTADSSRAHAADGRPW